ncbi:MAG: 1-deoxy-D-xylulose-5-phosphate reductoisomerase [Gemmatimonadetes bacterium]|nr:MAG: 1-deoxy-D-xylulose-5-phosphate reductoisomerase [Gemmatimonadota bacterium]
MIRLAILGSTGSIGRSTLEVVRRHPGRFEVVALAARRSAAALAEQAHTFSPRAVVLVDGEAPAEVEGGARWGRGSDALIELARRDDVDVVVNAIVGAAGLEATLAALEAGKRLALANKESLVAGGPLVRRAAEAGGGELVPVDSEHSAILQCLAGCDRGSVRRLVLTASGGPFRGWDQGRLAAATPRAALRHPTWDMGAKITIDSATLANKALEVIEAHYLYGLDYDRIEAVVHPQSVVHSFVEFVDGSVLAQLGFPTMELPILYALTHPERLPDEALRTFDPVRASPLTFEPIDSGAFRLFALGVEAGRRGGTATAVYNAANEIAVRAFLEERITFPGMADVVEAALTAVAVRNVESLDDVLRADREAREAARRAVESRPGAEADGRPAAEHSTHRPTT